MKMNGIEMSITNNKPEYVAIKYHWKKKIVNALDFPGVFAAITHKLLSELHRITSTDKHYVTKLITHKEVVFSCSSLNILCDHLQCRLEKVSKPACYLQKLSGVRCF